MTRKVKISEDAQVFVHDFDQFVAVRLLDETPAILLLEKLCSKHGYLFEWKNGETPRLARKWRVNYLYNGQLRTSCRTRTVIQRRCFLYENGVTQQKLNEFSLQHDQGSRTVGSVAIVAQAISCSNVRGVLPDHELFWFCLVHVSTTQFCSFPPVLMKSLDDGSDVPISLMPIGSGPDLDGMSHRSIDAQFKRAPRYFVTTRAGIRRF